MVQKERENKSKADTGIQALILHAAGPSTACGPPNATRIDPHGLLGVIVTHLTPHRHRHKTEMKEEKQLVSDFHSLLGS